MKKDIDWKSLQLLAIRFREMVMKHPDPMNTKTTLQATPVDCLRVGKDMCPTQAQKASERSSEEATG